METDPVIRRLIAWGSERDDVRAMLITSTRAIPGATFDAYSDYDIILVVGEVRPYLEDRSWIADFGDVLVAWWDPVQSDGPLHQQGNVTQYADGLKIDFGIWSVGQFERIANSESQKSEFDAGYRVFLDKDGLTVNLPAPTYRSYLPTPPDKATFIDNVEGFFVGAPYVAKCLLRDELMPAKWCLDFDMRDIYLRTMLTWWVGTRTEWSAKIGSLGKGLKEHLPADLWSEIEASYAGGKVEDNWESLFRLIAVYSRVTPEVAAALGFEYPVEMERRVIEFVQRMQRGEFGPIAPERG